LLLFGNTDWGKTGGVGKGGGRMRGIEKKGGNERKWEGKGE
jgi:hypothetical protein